MKLLKKLYEISSPSGKEQVMRSFIKSLLSGMKVNFTEDKVGNIYATKGESDTYPCIVCHTDEVHKHHAKGFCVVEANGIIFGLDKDDMTFEGIGADDKNGIWVCLKALNDFDVLKCAFFVSEEVGCIGSSNADMAFFNDCRFVLQCDRRGNNDFIINASGTELCSAEFVEAIGIHNFGYEVERGLMTDVMTLKDNGLKVSACNISCGYYNPHSSNEITNIADLRNCYALVSHIITTLTDVYPHESFDQYELYDDSCNVKAPSVYGGYDWWDESDIKYASYSKEYDNMYEDMYQYASENENFSLKTFISLYGASYPSLYDVDFEFACEDIMGAVIK